MVQELFTEDQIVTRMLKIMQKKKEHVTRNGKTFIPKTEDDISPRLRKPTIKGKLNKNRSRAYNSLYAEFITKPKKQALKRKINKKHMQASKSNIVAKGPTVNTQVAKYKEVARTGRVNEDTFVNIVNEYRQVLNLVKSTLTPEGAIVMEWEAKS